MQNTKHSIKTSLTALLLCFVMLVGTTFAWFTDEVTSANNIIKAGNLKIGMSWSVDNANWNEVEEDSDPIFNHTTWEPGYTEVRYVKVRNDGSLAFKYQMAINPNGPVDKLAEVIDVSYDVVTGNNAFVAPTANDKQGSLTKVGTLDQLIDENGIVAGGVLLPANELVENYYSGEIVVCISLHMDEYAGNEYQDKSIGTNFGINLYATQFDYENDSFDNSYDDDATWPYEMNFDTTVSIGGVQTLNNELVEELTIRFNDSIYAVLPAGVKLADGIDSLSFSGKTVENANNIIVEDADKTQGYDIHIEGIADDNQQPIKVYLGAILDKNISDTSLKLYHESTPMTRVNSVADFASNNQFTYDPATGNVVLYVDNFSEFQIVETSADAWDGVKVADGFASGSGTEADPYVIETAAQLVYFRNQVDAGNSFKGKFVKLDADINLARKSFDPIGFGYWDESKVDANGTDTNTVFMGTFDGGNHTIYNLYENCWELDPDTTNYSTYTYSTAGAGLFASIKDATIKNLMINGAEIVFECVDMGVVVGYAQGTCHFENIIVANAQIANYNRYTGGVVGEVSYGPYGTDTNKGYSHTFKNVTVDSTVTVSGLWGSFGCGMGGVIGGKWGDATVKMENVISAPVMDVYNDVVSAYQWYAFRGCGMLIGHTEEPYSDGRHSGKATASFLTCEDVTVYYGDWVNYTYYQFANQTDAQGNKLWYSNYPWVRVEAGKYCDAFSNIRYGIPQVNGVKVTELGEEAFNNAVTGRVEIPFDQLYGADRGMYGTATHPGVTVLRDAYITKTVYFENNQNWENVYIYYWCQNGNDEWDNCAFPGQPMTLVQASTEGIYDVYSFKVPAFAKGFIFSNGIPVDEEGNYQTHDILLEDIDTNGKFFYTTAIRKVTENDKLVDYKYDVGYLDYNNAYKTVYFKNYFKWDNLQMYYNVNNTWIQGAIKLLGYDGSYEYYSVAVPNYATAFNVSGEKNDGYGNREQTVDINVNGLTENVMYTPSGTNSSSNVTVSKSTFDASVLKSNYRQLYIKPTSSWMTDNAKLALYVFGSGDGWYSVSDNYSGTYKIWIDSKYTSIIVCRMSSSTNNWNNVWNQSVDIALEDGKNLWTMNNWSGGQSTGKWSTKK